MNLLSLGTLLQLAMAVFGLAALAMATSRNAGARRWSCAVGLLGQPAWVAFAYQSNAWGLAALAAAYTLVYLRGLLVAMEII